ncbi:hypothetical protein [Micromonospora sp. NBC_00421]|uniref:hypothetical protein n=1 Tax=Micromonospora sp. NBC_00421 TaxID=2975976 RepID=UPI002E1B8F54
MGVGTVLLVAAAAVGALAVRVAYVAGPAVADPSAPLGHLLRQLIGLFIEASVLTGGPT